jgi:hypothetical protein
MRRTILYIAIFMVAYCLTYVLGQPVAMQSTPIARVWATAFYPLRLIQFRHLYSAVRREQGTLDEDTKGAWGLTYAQPKTDPHNGHPIHGIGFRVPAHLLDATRAAKGQLVNATIASEPDPEHFNCATYVLTSVTPAPL